MNPTQLLGRLLLATASMFLLAGLEPADAAPPFESWPEKAKQLWKEGQGYQERGYYRAALAAYEDAIEEGMAGFPRIHLHKAQCWYAQGEYRRAERQYDWFLARFDSTYACNECMRLAYEGRAKARAALGDATGAMADYDTALTLYKKELAKRDDKNVTTPIYYQNPEYRPARTTSRIIPSGWVELVNTWERPVTFRVNGTAYRLWPGERQVVTVPGLRFTYEIDGIQPLSERLLDAGQGRTIHVYRR